MRTSKLYKVFAFPHFRKLYKVLNTLLLVMGKSAFLKEDTRVLLNKARAIFLNKNPEMNKATDDNVIHAALTNYVGD